MSKTEITIIYLNIQSKPVYKISVSGFTGFSSRLTRGVWKILFSQAEINLLMLSAWCKDLPKDSDFLSQESIQLFLTLGYIRASRSGLSYRTTTKGYHFLEDAGYDFPKDKQYCGDPAVITRRTNMAEIMLFLQNLGIDVFLQSPAEDQNRFLPSFTFRRKKAANILGGTRLAGFIYQQSEVFIPYFISGINDGLYPLVEERVFRAKELSQKKTPVIVYTGKGDLNQIILNAQQPREKKARSTTISFWDAIWKFTSPVLIIPLSLDGARQFRIIYQKDAIMKITKGLLGTEYAATSNTHYDAVIKSSGEPLIAAIGCELKRIFAALQFGKTLHLIVLEHHIATFQSILKNKKVILHPVSLETVESMLNLSQLPDKSGIPYISKEGRHLIVPAFQTDRKTGKKAGRKMENHNQRTS